MNVHDEFRVSHIADQAAAIQVAKALRDCEPCGALMNLVRANVVSLHDATQAYFKRLGATSKNFVVGYTVADGEREEWELSKRYDY